MTTSLTMNEWLIMNGKQTMIRSNHFIYDENINAGILITARKLKNGHCRRG